MDNKENENINVTENNNDEAIQNNVSVENNIKNENEEVVNNETKKVKKEKKKSISIFQNIVIILLILVIGLLIYNNRTHKLEQYIPYRFYTIISGSMCPEIQIGDVVLIEKGTEVQVDDIVAYELGNSTLVHRIIEKNEVDGKVSYTTKGDFNNAPDIKTVEKDQIVGKSIYIIPKVGHIAIFLMNNYIYIVGGILVIVVLILIYRVYKSE